MADTTPDFKDVLRVLLDKAAKWYSIGLHLELSPGELDTIKADCNGAEECLTKAIRKWHSNADPPPTWRTVIEALKTRAVGESVLAGQLEEKYVPKASTEIFPDLEYKASLEVSRQNVTKIKKGFAALLKNVAVKLKSRQELDLEVFRLFIVNLFPPGDFISDSTSVITIFEAISKKGLWSYWHYSPVENIVKEYAPEDVEAKGWLANYKKELGGYKVTTMIADAIELYGSGIEEFEDCDRSHPLATSYDPDYLRKLSVKLKTPVTGKTLEYVDDLWLSLAEYFLLPALSALLDNIKRGCIEVSWLIPPHFMFQIVGNLQENTSFLETTDIIEVVVEGECVYNRAQEDELRKTLLDVVSKGDIDELVPLLMSGIDINITFKGGLTSLMIACREGHVQVVDCLLQHGANAEIKSTTGWTAVMIACRNGHLNIVLMLLEKQADIGAITQRGYTCLMTACYFDHTDVVDFLLTLPHVDVKAKDMQGLNVLMHACSGRSVDVVNILLKHPDIDVNERSHDIGRTALMDACARGHTECVELLLSKHADPSIQNDYGWTALFCACFGGHVQIVKVLLTHGVDLNTQDEDGWTPLIAASCEGHLDVVQELLKGGANPNVKNNKGETALFVARDFGHKAIVEELNKCTDVDTDEVSLPRTDSHFTEQSHDAQRDIMERERTAMLHNRRIFREILDSELLDINPPKSLSYTSMWQDQQHSEH